MKLKLYSIAALALGGAAAHEYKICSGTTDEFGLTKVDLSPDPVLGNKPLTVTFTGTPTKSFDNGSNATLTVKLLGVKLATLNFDACNDLGMACPVAVGKEITGTITYTVPTAVPPGLTANVELVMKDAKGAVITCVDVDAKLGATKSKGLLRAATDPFGNRKQVEEIFSAWMKEHDFEMPEDPSEFVRRLDIFADNLRSIYRHNHNMGTTYKKAMNQFGHLTAEEFKAQYLGFLRPEPAVEIPRDVFTFPAVRKLELDDAVDWTSKGAVTPPKNQGSCGSCWSYSTSGAVEGAYFIKSGSLVSLSEQMLVSCDTTDSGCNGGLMDNAFTWIGTNGLCTEDDYPYVQGSTTTVPACDTTCTPVAGTGVASHTDVDKTEAALMAAVAAQPVSIAIEADQTAFQFYSSGVMTDTCGTSLDHGVLAVGYGTESGTDYWKVKNSWGATWGVDGYILLQRGLTQEGGQCGILMSASYPTLA